MKFCMLLIVVIRQQPQRGEMTYGTRQRRSESDMPATESERPVERMPNRQSRGQSEGLRSQLEGKEGSWRV